MSYFHRNIGGQHIGKGVAKVLGRAIGLQVVSRRKSMSDIPGGEKVLEQLSQKWSTRVTNQNKWCSMNEQNVVDE